MLLHCKRMANPQKENGYVPVANEIYDALCRIRIPGEARQVLDVIIRKTYGFQKKSDCIALSQFSLATGLSKIAVRKALNKLLTLNIITQKGNDVAKEYGIIKDYSLWKPLPKKVTLPKKVRVVTQKGNKRYPKRAPQKTKYTITKDNTAANAALPKFNKEETRKKWYEGEDDRFSLLAWFFDKKGLWPRLTSRPKVEAAVSRHIRSATRLINGDWSQEECNKALERMIEANPKMRTEWHLETLEKYLTK